MLKTKRAMIDKCKEITEMDRKELDKFGFTLSVSFLDDKKKKILYKVMKARLDELTHRSEIGADVVCSEVLADELGY